MSDETLPATIEPKAPLRSGGGMAPIIPQDAEQAFRMAQLIVKSGMAPNGMQTPEKIVTAILHGLEVGLKPMQAIQSIAVVNGRPCIWGDAALGLVMGSGTLEDIHETVENAGTDKAVATCRAKRAGMTSAIERRFSVDDAKRAGLWGKQGPWQQYSQRMLQMRARSWCLRDGFADVLKGLHVVEEVRDFHGPIAAANLPPITKQDLLAPPSNGNGGARASGPETAETATTGAASAPVQDNGGGASEGRKPNGEPAKQLHDAAPAKSTVALRKEAHAKLAQCQTADEIEMVREGYADAIASDTVFAERFDVMANERRRKIEMPETAAG